MFFPVYIMHITLMDTGPLFLDELEEFTKTKMVLYGPCLHIFNTVEFIEVLCVTLL